MLDMQKTGPPDSNHPNMKGKEARGHIFGFEGALLIISGPCIFKTSDGMTSAKSGLTAGLPDIHWTGCLFSSLLPFHQHHQ